MSESNVKKFAQEQVSINQKQIEMIALLERALLATINSLPKDIQAAIRKHQQFAPVLQLNANNDLIVKKIKTQEGLLRFL